MTGGESRFTSDRRAPGSTSWEDATDWEAGTAENIEISGEDLVAPNVANDGTFDSVIDNFELDGGVPEGIYTSGETISDYYKGYTQSYSFTESNVIDGNRALSYDPDDGQDQKILSEPNDGLPNYPEKGDTVSRLQRGNSSTGGGPGSSDLLLLCGAYDSENGTVDAYAFGIDFGWGDVVIWRFENSVMDQNDGRTEIARSSVSVSDDTWYWTEIDMPGNSGSMEIRVYEANTQTLEAGTQLGSASATDTNVSPDNRGIGMCGRRRGSSGDPNYDRVQLKEAGP